MSLRAFILASVFCAAGLAAALACFLVFLRA